MNRFVQGVHGLRARRNDWDLIKEILRSKCTQQDWREIDEAIAFVQGEEQARRSADNRLLEPPPRLRITG
jgi:hypothetical protein